MQFLTNILSCLLISFLELESFGGHSTYMSAGVCDKKILCSSTWQVLMENMFEDVRKCDGVLIDVKCQHWGKSDVSERIPLTHNCLLTIMVTTPISEGLLLNMPLFTSIR